MRIALDLLGGDAGISTAVIDGALLAAARDPGLRVTLVGPPPLAAGLLRERGGTLEVVAASQAIAMDEEPARAVRAKRDATVRVAARLVRDGQAEAMVTMGSTGAAVAAGLFTLGRLPGVTRPALALVLRGPGRPVVFLDAGANVACSPDLLAQFALAGAALATVQLGIADPSVGLLSIGAEAGKGDEARKLGYDLLSALPLRFIGNVEGHDVPLGGRADVIVTDGFTGNVLLKGLEGTLRTVQAALGPFGLTPEQSGALGALGADGYGGAVLLGVDGVVLVGHGSAGPAAVASALAAAAAAVRDGLVPRVREALAGLVARRRLAAGLPVAVP